jgi:hypothetical protein
MCGDCCCGTSHGERHGYRRQFMTKAEKLEKLKNYEEELKKELEAVQEHIKELGK